MRALRVVGITEGGGELSVVLEDSARQERFTVPADEQLRAAARGDLTRLGQIAIELESQLRPREIQARIRAGASVDQVAAAAGVPSQKIERFAYPVLLERSRTAEVAQRAHPMRADGPDTRMLADVVAHTFGLRGQEYVSAEWDSWKGDDGRWVVALSWRAGRSDNRALWTFQPGAHGGTVTAIDEHAHDLVEGLPARPLRTVGPVIDISRPDEQPPPAPEEGHELRAAASDIAARRDVSDWSRVAPEPRRPESRRPAARPEPGEVRTASPTPGPVGPTSPPPNGPLLSGSPSPHARRGPRRRGSGGRRDSAPAARGQANDRPPAPPLGRADDSPRAAGSRQTDERDSTSTSPAADTPGAAARRRRQPDPAPCPATARPSASPSGSYPSATTAPRLARPPPPSPAPTAPQPSGTRPAPARSGATPSAPTGDRVRGLASRRHPGRHYAGWQVPPLKPTTARGRAPQPQRAPRPARPRRPPTPLRATHRRPKPLCRARGRRRSSRRAIPRPRRLTSHPPNPPHPVRPSPKPPPRSRRRKRTRKGKPVMPSWDEVLLGVRSQR